MSQSLSCSMPMYNIIETSGQSHCPTFKIQVIIEDDQKIYKKKVITKESEDDIWIPMRSEVRFVHKIMISQLKHQNQTLIS